MLSRPVARLMCRLIAFLALAARWTGTPLSAQAAAPPVPYEDAGACPFEGCVYRTWTANAPVSVRDDRTVSAPEVFTVGRGEAVSALTGVVVTLRPGRVEFREPTTLPTASGGLKIEPGQTLYLLTYRGEGFFRAWFEGRLYDDVDASPLLTSACDASPERCAGRIVERAESVWWVRVRNGRGQTGWTSEPEKFDGKDALSGR